MGSDRGACGRPRRRLRAAVVFAVIAGALFAAPNALAGTYWVTDSSDTAGTCAMFGPCTLRQAINAANGDPGSTIEFHIGIGGSYDINPTSPLPAIASSVTIDATTQTGYA